jgi:hypothetical protein
MTFSLENINLDTINLRYTDAFQNRPFRQTKAPRNQNFWFRKMDFEVLKIKGLDLKYKQSIA